MDSPQLRHVMRSASRSPHRKPRSRHASECEPLQIKVKQAVKYLGPPDITNCYLMFSCPRGHALIINNEQFDERYLGLSRAEVALRERMAKKYGRKANHLDATN